MSDPLVERCRDLAKRLRENRLRVHGDCCEDSGDDAVPCGSIVCAIEYEAETLLAETATQYESLVTALRGLQQQWEENGARHKQHGDCYRVGEGWALETCAQELAAILSTAGAP